MSSKKYDLCNKVSLVGVISSQPYLRDDYQGVPTYVFNVRVIDEYHTSEDQNDLRVYYSLPTGFNFSEGDTVEIHGYLCRSKIRGCPTVSIVVDTISVVHQSTSHYAGVDLDGIILHKYDLQVKNPKEGKYSQVLIIEHNPTGGVQGRVTLKLIARNNSALFTDQFCSPQDQVHLKGSLDSDTTLGITDARGVVFRGVVSSMMYLEKY